MIYLKYISYLNGSSGKMKLSISPLFEDIAYNDENNIFQNLEECKKLVLKISKNPIEFFIISKLWDMTFYSRKFSYKDISEETKNTFGDKITKTKAFNIIKHIHINVAYQNPGRFLEIGIVRVADKAQANTTTFQHRIMYY